MTHICVTLVVIARNRLRDGFDGLMHLPIHQFLFVLQSDEKLRAVIVWRKQLPFVADEQAATARDFVTSFPDCDSGLFRRFVVAVVLERMLGPGIAAVIPPESHWPQAFTRGEF